MLRYLNGESNVKGGPNENYGREFMELFTLGVNHVVTGAKNYSENDVAQLAKSFTGLVHRRQRSGSSSLRCFDSAPLVQRPEVGLRQARQLQHRQRRRPRAQPGRPRALHRQQAVGRVHADAASDPDAAEARGRLRRRAGASSSRWCAAILTNPQLFESIDEPNMIKPPVVFVARRAARARPRRHLRPSRPTISTRWASSPTSRRPWPAGRAVSRGSTRTPPSPASASSPTSSPTRRTARRRRSSTSRTRRRRQPSTVRSAPSGRPGCLAGTRAAIQDYAARASAKASKDRIARQVMLRTLMLAGPDAQVM